MTDNLSTFNSHPSYAPQHLWSDPTTVYDRRMVEIRRSILCKRGDGKDVVDLCCGSGAYLVPMLDRVKSAVGIDFSASMLDGFLQQLHGVIPPQLKLMKADATSLPLPDASTDFLFSFTSLYYIPRVDLAIREIARVLRPGGIASVELGNLLSLNTLIANGYSAELGWAKSHHITVRKMREYIQQAGLTVTEWRSFQLSPMYGVPRRHLWLYPVAHPRWKALLGMQIRGRMLDEWVSSAWFLRSFAFRHLITVRKP